MAANGGGGQAAAAGGGAGANMNANANALAGLGVQAQNGQGMQGMNGNAVAGLGQNGMQAQNGQAVQGMTVQQQQQWMAQMQQQQQQQQQNQNGGLNPSAGGNAGQLSQQQQQQVQFTQQGQFMGQFTAQPNNQLPHQQKGSMTPQLHAISTPGPMNPATPGPINAPTPSNETQQQNTPAATGTMGTYPTHNTPNAQLFQQQQQNLQQQLLLHQQQRTAAAAAASASSFPPLPTAAPPTSLAPPAPAEISHNPSPQQSRPLFGGPESIVGGTHVGPTATLHGFLARRAAHLPPVSMEESLRDVVGVDGDGNARVKRTVDDLLREGEREGWECSEEVEKILYDLADTFIDQTTTLACHLTLHRHATTLTPKDLAFPLELTYNLRVPVPAGGMTAESLLTSRSLPKRGPTAAAAARSGWVKRIVRDEMGAGRRREAERRRREARVVAGVEGEEGETEDD
ncbi:putative tRNA threonylcarbamoyladenosine biosynthesis protein kae1 [Podochytrium sp. JEL0797]|nr:putative tRNA threonylcarbamoyladenosine biosynthesis protein kae1 [Podochytrium sp. JEL0797]